MLITILTVCWDGKVEQEFGEFYCSSRDSSNVQIQVVKNIHIQFLRCFISFSMLIIFGYHFYTYT
jgi:hypothetical protein